MKGDAELRAEGVETERVFGRSCQSVWFSVSSLRSAREDVPAELTLHERHKRREARGTHVAREARGGRTEGRRAEGKSRLIFFLSFPLGLCANACGEAPVGDTVEPFKCCRVFAYPDIFFLCIVSCCCTLIALYMCD